MHHTISKIYKHSIVGENMTVLKFILFTTKKTSLKLKDKMYFSTKTIKHKGIQILQAKATVNYHNKIEVKI